MKNIYNIGDKTQLFYTIKEEDLAGFNGNLVHPFFSTFALGREAEWTCRQFVLNMKEEDEEGIGTFLNIIHQSPAMVNETVTFEAEIVLLEKNCIDCKFTVYINNRIIATGTQGQKILKKEKIKSLINQIQQNEKEN